MSAPTRHQLNAGLLIFSDVVLVHGIAYMTNGTLLRFESYTPSGPAPNAPKPQPRPERPWWKFWSLGEQ